MKVLVTGAQGFLGWHTRLRLHAESSHEVLPVGRGNWPTTAAEMDGVDAVIHIAGVNRAEAPEDVENGNVSLGESLAALIAGTGRRIDVVYASSIQAELDNPYGRGKKKAGEILRAAAEGSGGACTEVLLPNIFGEHGRPGYNSFVATFVAAAIAGDTPQVVENQVELLHAQRAATVLVGALGSPQATVRPAGEFRSVGEVWRMLQGFHATYLPAGEIPDLSDDFSVDLFNTYRAALFPSHYPIALIPHSDQRGSFVETIRCRGGEGQASFSTTVPGVTRGEHYHLRKIERFVVIAGRATINLRKMFTDEVLSFEVNGETPVAIDMPTGWIHNMVNTGEELLLTQFWSHELFRPIAPDTYPENVVPTKEVNA